MEHLKSEFEGEPGKTTHTHETRPPRRPDKVPLNGRAEVTTAEHPRVTYSQVLLSGEPRTSSTALPNMDAADTAISGSRIPEDPNSRLAQFWQQPKWYFIAIGAQVPTA
jgi:hypothetical protein